MKIYIITLHRAENYGSVLQAFALQEFLKQMGHDVSILDYHPKRYTTKGRLLRLKKHVNVLKNPVKLFLARVLILPSYWRKDYVFNRFIRKCLQVTPISFSTNEEAIGLFDDGDAYCTGSDQVWNSFWNERVEKALYLDFVPEKKMIFSYAASIGLTEIAAEELEQMSILLNKYKYISVREDSGLDIIRSIGRKDVVQHIDPTLLFPSDFWDRFTDNRFKYAKYILTYNLHHDPLIDRLAHEISQMHNIKIVNISYNWHDLFRNGNLAWCPSVEKFLGLIKHAEYVIADSFHATAFSVIFKKRFLTITPEIARSRISSFLKKIGLENRLVEGCFDSTIIDATIDYNNVEAILVEERLKSTLYFMEILNSLHKNK